MGKAYFILLLFCWSASVHAQAPSAPGSGVGPSALLPIRVVCDDNYPPYSFRDEAGKVQGIIPDQWRAFSEATGRPVDFNAMDWVSAQMAMLEGRADVLDSAFRTRERERVYDFLPPYADIKVSIFFHSSISGISQFKDLKGFRIGAKAGDAVVETLRAQNIGDLVLFPNYESLIKAAKNQELRIFCMDDPAAYYFLYKYGMDDAFRSALTLPSGQFHRAVRRNRASLTDGADLYTVLDEGFKTIPQRVYDAIDERWMGSRIPVRIDWQVVIWVAGAAILTILVLVIFSLALRAQVAKKTRELLGKTRALAASERKNRAFISALPDLFIIMDGDGRYLEVITSNPSILFRPVEDRIGKLIEETGLDPVVAKLFRDAVQVFSNGAQPEPFQYRLKVAAGDRHFEARSIPLDENRILFIVRDINDARNATLKLEESLREKEILLREIHHRVKNNMQVISSLIQLQSSSVQSDHDRSLLEDTQQRIRSMAQVHELLYQSDQLAFVSASDYIALLYQELASSYYEVSRFVNPYLDIDPLQLPLDTAIPLGLIVNELVSNALKYAYILNPTGQLRIILKAEGSRRVLRIEDDGVGLPEDWEKNLPNTLGLTLVQSLAQQLQGALDIRVDSGTKVRLEF